MSSQCFIIKQEFEKLKAHKMDFVSACKSTGSFDALSSRQLKDLQIKKRALEEARDILRDTIVVTPERAKEIMGDGNYFGLEALKTTFGIELNRKEIPRIPFTAQELEKARERGEMLIFRTDRTQDGTPLTAKVMEEYYQPFLERMGKGRVLCNMDFDGRREESAYTSETCRSGWALVSKKVLRDSTNINYLEQTDRIIKEVRIIYGIGRIPKKYQDAIDEFDRERRGIDILLSDPRTWEQAAVCLASLAITQLTRQRFIEALSDILTVALNTPHTTRFLGSAYAWTCSRGFGGTLLDIGQSDGSGANMRRWDPGSFNFFLGVVLSRRGIQK